MAVIKYKDSEGNFHKVSIGGGNVGTDEVYIGSGTPPNGTKIWIDPTTQGGGNQPSGGGESEPIVIYCPMDNNFGEGHKETNVTNVALLTEDFNNRKFHSNLLIAITAEGVITGCCSPILYTCQNGILRIMISITAMGGDIGGNMTLVAMPISVDTNGDVTLN